MHLIAGVIPASSGQVIYKKRRLKANSVSLILQQPIFYGAISLYENINIVRFYNKTKRKKEIVRLAKLLQINKILRRKASLCSGGEKARASIVRGLFMNKRVTLVDEPTAHLDYENSLFVADVLSYLAKRQLLIVATHQAYLFSAANVIKLKIDQGQVVEDVSSN